MINGQNPAINTGIIDHVTQFEKAIAVHIIGAIAHIHQLILFGLFLQATIHFIYINAQSKFIQEVVITTIYEWNILFL